MGQRMRRNKSYIYSDMKVGLPVTQCGNIRVLYDDDCIKQSLMSIFATVSLERVRNPIGSGLVRLLFQPVSPTTARQIRAEMIGLINRWEPRVSVTRFIITPDMGNHTYDVDVTYTISKLGREYNMRTRLRSIS